MREFFLNSGIYFEENVPLKKLTTFGTGGPARYVVQPKDEREISAVLTYLKQNDVPYFCLGGGSNVLASDDGSQGVSGGAFRLHQRTFGGGVSCGNPRVHGRSGVYERRLL